jgi:protein involved in polysaccharide export with SLBB domain
MHKNIRPILLAGIACSLVLLLAGCASDSPGPSSSTQTPPPTSEQASIDPMRYDPLRPGDKLAIDLNAGTVLTIPSIYTDIKGDGTINLPEIGRIEAANQTPGELEKVIQTNYVPAYYTHMNVTVTPLTRFFYVGGEINQSGSGGRQAYTGPITVTQAIRAAGDFNPFAAKKKVQLRRALTGKTFVVNCVKAIDHPELDLSVFPGDTIFVPRRFW